MSLRATGSLRGVSFRLPDQADDRLQQPGNVEYAHDGCGGGFRVLDPHSLGVVPGQQSVVTMTMVGEQGTAERGRGPVLPLPAGGTFGLGVAEVVPVSEYPFPPRPQTLAPLFPNSPGTTVELQADQSNPAGPKETTIEWPDLHHILVRTNTPGRIRVLVNDVELIDFSSWSYAVTNTQLPHYTDWEKSYGLKLQKGQPAKITVIPERTTGDWSVEIIPR